MAQRVYHVGNKEEYDKAAAADLIELDGPAGSHPLFLPQGIIETVVWGIANGESIHLSGPSGTAKTSLLEYLYLVPSNFLSVCGYLGIEARPLELFPIEMAVFETPGQLFQMRSLKNGNTFDEESVIIQALRRAAELKNTTYPLIWLREMGRVHTASTQGGLVNLMVRDGDTILPDGLRIDGRGVAWITDSNYQADNGSNFSLVPLDSALQRRFSLNVTMDHLQPDEEILVLRNILDRHHAEIASSTRRNGGKIPEINDELIETAVTLGQLIRKHRVEGRLLSIAPPSIHGYLTFIKTALALTHQSLQDIARSTLLGNANAEDMRDQIAVINQALGLLPDENIDETDVTDQTV